MIEAIAKTPVNVSRTHSRLNMPGVIVTFKAVESTFRSIAICWDERKLNQSALVRTLGSSMKCNAITLEEKQPPPSKDGLAVFNDGADVGGRV